MTRLPNILLLCLLLAACQSPPPKAEAPAAKPKPEQDKLGEYPIDPASKVWADYDCAQAKYLPLAFLEHQKLNPDTIAAGGEFVHRMVYALCPAVPDQPLKGTLYRRIYFNGRLVHNAPEPFELKPGRFGVNAIIKVPEQSKPGAYKLQVEFTGFSSKKHKVKITEETQFEVVEDAKGSK